MTVQEDVTKVMKDFHSANKHIGLCCIAPILAAKVFGSNSGGKGAKLTLGCKGDDWPYNGSIDAATSFGNEMVDCDLDNLVIDEQNKITTAPAYMKGTANPAGIFENVKAMVDSVAHQFRQETQTGPVVAIIQVSVKAEQLNEFKEAIYDNARNSRLEAGCLRFDVC